MYSIKTLASPPVKLQCNSTSKPLSILHVAFYNPFTNTGGSLSHSALERT